MDTETDASSDNGIPEIVGRLIGVALVAIVVSLASSFALCYAWNLGPARLFRLPTATWAEALACFVSIWVLTSPLRYTRVKTVE